MQLAAQAVQFLNSTITSNGASNKLGIQFGAYATFSALFALMNMTTPTSNLSAQDAINFQGMVDYASSMVFELYSTTTSANASAYTSTADLNVRFLFHNGTATNTSAPTAYPIFGSSSLSMPWTDFVTNMNAISVGTTEEWCKTCGYSSGSSAVCNSSISSSSTSTTSHSGGLSNTVSGVVGALITLAVILGLQAVFLLAGGYKLISRKKLLENGRADYQGAYPLAETDVVHTKA